MAAARVAWRASAGEIDPARLIFIDESGFDTRLIRTHARALHGQRAYGTVPGGHWERLTLRHKQACAGIGALGLGGICAAMTVAAATGTAVFLAFVTQVLIPTLKHERPDAVVVMDNPVTSALVTSPPTRPLACARRLRRRGSATATCPPTRRT